MNEDKALVPGDRVRVSKDSNWACGATGTVSDLPGYHPSFKAGQMNHTWTRDGRQFFWIKFDEAQESEGDTEGPFEEGAVDCKYLEKA